MFYYEVLDNWVNFDFGLIVCDLDGELVVCEVGGVGQVSRIKVDGVLFMGYFVVCFDLFMIGVFVGVEGNFVSYSGDLLYDFNVYGQFEIVVVQFWVGYCQMFIDYEDDDD